jgi:chemotaxis protein MotB
MSVRRISAPRDDTDELHTRDRWLVSYADFITLLMGFFVVLYSVSSVNDGKFRVLSNSMVTVFNQDAAGAAPIDLGGGVPPQDRIQIAPQNVAALEFAADQVQTSTTTPGAVASLPPDGSPRERLEHALGPLLKRDDVHLRDTRQWLEVELPSELLFGSGSADLQPQALGALKPIAALIADLHKPARVEGHTDNVPIRGGRYASNWHLSAARAASVAAQLVGAAVPPELLSAAGYGEFRPLADNADEAGRKRNRRVVIAIAKDPATAAAISAPDRKEAARRLQRVTELPPAAEIEP